MNLCINVQHDAVPGWVMRYVSCLRVACVCVCVGAPDAYLTVSESYGQVYVCIVKYVL